MRRLLMTCDDTFNNVASNLEENVFLAISGFKTNRMIVNPSKFHVTATRSKDWKVEAEASKKPNLIAILFKRNVRKIRK